MGRPREFDEAEVLDACAKQFRVHGFADTSTDQLCLAAGVKRSTLYNSFVSKEEVFVRALERSTSLALEEQKTILTDATLSGSDRLLALFNLTLVEEASARKLGHAAGCMIVTSRMAPDLAAREPRVQSLLDYFTDRQLTLVADVIAVGTKDGSLRKDLVPRDAALMVVSAVFGIRVLSQSGVPLSSLRKVASLHLQALKS